MVISTTPAVLRRPEDLTPQWCTAALQRAGALGVEAAVASVAVASAVGTGQMADTVRFDLAYRGGSGPPTVIGKFAAADDNSRNTGLALRCYEIEVRFYEEVASLVGARVPACYGAAVDPATGWFTLVLEDIAGAEQGDQLAGCDGGTAALLLGEIALVHAPCWESPRLEGREWLARSSPESSRVTGQLLAGVLPGFLERYGDRLSKEHRAVCERVVGDAGSLLVERSGPRTVTHGDFRLDNVLFPLDGGRPAIVDWQTALYAPAAGDVAYLLGGSLSTEERRAHEADLLDAYHDALARAGVRDYGLDALETDYRRAAVNGLFVAVGASMLVARTDRGDDMFVRSASLHAQHVLDAETERLAEGRHGG